jgi:hypothetical protein
LLARFGHPSALNALLHWMAGDDIALAAAAGEAFTRMTGAEVRGKRQQVPVPDDADEFAREMAPDLWLPDVPKARALMERHGAEWAAGARWCNGLRLDGEVSRDLLTQLDLEARWEVAARAALAGRRVPSRSRIEAVALIGLSAAYGFAIGGRSWLAGMGHDPDDPAHEAEFRVQLAAMMGAHMVEESE